MGARKPTSSPPRRAGRIPRSWMSALGHLALLAAVGATLSLTYLLFVVLSGTLAYDIIAGTALQQMTRNVDLARTIFLWSLWIVVAASMIRHYSSDSVGFAVLLAGLGCWAILPFLIGNRISEHSTALIDLGYSLAAAFRLHGVALMVVGSLRLVVARLILVSRPAGAAGRLRLLGPEAREIAAYRASQKPSAMRRCWELQFCRSSLRNNCPRFLEGVSCWKRGSGCYCDQGLATRLLSEVGARARVEVAEELDAAQRRGETVSGPRRAAAKEKRAKPPCGECPIYLDHQTYKYRVVSWLAYPAAAAIVGFFVAPIRYSYEWVQYRLGDMLGQLQVLPQHTIPGTAFDTWLSAENVMVVLIGIFVVGVLLQLTEVVIFRLKW